MSKLVRKWYDRVGYPIEAFSKSRTLQQFAEPSDINNIVRRYKVRDLERMYPATPLYGDFSGLSSNYHEALNKVMEADKKFMALPAFVRAHFDNDVAKFVEFASVPGNEAEWNRLVAGDSAHPAAEDHGNTAVKAVAEPQGDAGGVAAPSPAGGSTVAPGSN